MHYGVLMKMRVTSVCVIHELLWGGGGVTCVEWTEHEKGSESWGGGGGDMC